jgi:glyoxylase-like metal-dependent hydrolase (beta-lactamase superfamily II)
MTISTVVTTTSVQAFRAKEGCQAHLVVDDRTCQAMVLDPRLDQVDEILDAAHAEHATIRYVLDTHTHADHLSGVHELARRTGAKVLSHPAATRRSDGVLRDGEVIALGETEVRVIHSAGHTPDSLSLLVDGHLFTGDALFAGSAGRTDFMGGSASDLYDSFRRFEALPDDTVVHPGHDYVGRPTTTIEIEREENELLREQDRDALIARLDVKRPLPKNMKTILHFNAKGPSERMISPLELDSKRQLRNRVHIVDVRGASEFRSRHIPESTHIPLAELESRIGEIPEDREVVLVCQSGLRSEEAARALQGGGRSSRQLEGGILAWSRMGLPTDGRGHLPIEQQVRLVAGSGVLAGSVLAAGVSPWFLLVPIFFGGGLTFSGVTGSCGLAAVLTRMPWNRHEEQEVAAPCAVADSSACASGSAPGGTGKTTV